MKIKGVETDLLEQFRNRPNTEALCAAINRQLDILVSVFEQIAFNTNIDNAAGKQLDSIGNIVGLTRAEASLLCGKTIYFESLDDERYRRYLKYKAFRNSNDGTYNSLVKAMQAVLGSDVTIAYEEDKDFPATIILDIMGDNSEKIYLGEIPPIKPAGVSVEYKVKERAKIEVSHILEVYISGIACGTHFCGTYPLKS